METFCWHRKCWSFVFNLLSFVVSSREENKSCLSIQCICKLIVIFALEISVSVLDICKYTNENTRSRTRFEQKWNLMESQPNMNWQNCWKYCDKSCHICLFIYCRLIKYSLFLMSCGMLNGLNCFPKYQPSHLCLSSHHYVMFSSMPSLAQPKLSWSQYFDNLDETDNFLFLRPASCLGPKTYRCSCLNCVCNAVIKYVSMFINNCLIALKTHLLSFTKLLIVDLCFA